MDHGYCTGVLIGEKTIMTAAQCVEDSDLFVVYLADNDIYPMYVVRILQFNMPVFSPSTMVNTVRTYVTCKKIMYK